MNLFLDTNVWLDLYRSSREELNEVAKLLEWLDRRRFTLYFTDQVIDEFNRNRESQVAEAVQRLMEDLTAEPLHPLCQGYPELGEMEEAARRYQEARDRLLTRLVADAAAERLPADGIVASLLVRAWRLEVTDEIFERARRRYDRGNPPGKEGSYGDAIHWECLLDALPDGEDLIFVSADRDFRSLLDEGAIAPFLADEWRRRKGGRVFFFRRLSAFLLAEREEDPEETDPTG